MRRLLVQAAHRFGRRAPDGELKRWFESVRQRAGRQKGAVALARKLGVLMHRLWTTNATCDPWHRRRGQRAQAA